MTNNPNPTAARQEVRAIELIDKRIASLREYSTMLHELDVDTNAEVHRNSEEINHLDLVLRPAILTALAPAPVAGGAVRPPSHTLVVGWPTIKLLAEKGEYHNAEQEVFLIAADDLHGCPVAQREAGGGEKVGGRGG